MTLTHTQTTVTPLDCGLTHPHGGPCAAGPYPVRPGAPRCDAALVTATAGGQLATVCLLVAGHAGPCQGDALGAELPAVWASVPAPDPAVLPEPAEVEGDPAPSPDAPPADDAPAPAPEEDAPHDPTTAEPANPTETDDDPDTLAGDADDDPDADPFTEED